MGNRAGGGPIAEADSQKPRNDGASVLLSLLRPSDLFNGAQSTARLHKVARCSLTDSSRLAHVFARCGWGERGGCSRHHCLIFQLAGS